MGHQRVREHRKALLYEFDHLRREFEQYKDQAKEAQSDILNEESTRQLMQRTFKMVIKAVKLYDARRQQLLQLQQTERTLPDASGEVLLAPYAEDSHTSALGRSRHEQTTYGREATAPAQTPLAIVTATIPDDALQHKETQLKPLPQSAASRSLQFVPPQNLHPASQDLSHRISWARPDSYRLEFALQQLTARHKEFLSSLSTFLDIHLLTQSSNDILLAAKQSLDSGLAVLNVVESVLIRSNRQSTTLLEAKESLRSELAELVGCAQAIIQIPDSERNHNDEMQRREKLKDYAMSCIESAKNCLKAAGKYLELKGDFKIEKPEARSDVEFHSTRPVQPASSPSTHIAPAPARAPPAPPSLTDSASSPGDTSPLSAVITSGVELSNTKLPPRKDSANATTGIASTTLKDENSPVSPVSPVSQSLTDQDLQDIESNVLRTTFAHELILTKEGQVTAGTLPALVEQLTTADNVPDPEFVSAFHLTFRTFTTPQAFAMALIDRFRYIENNEISALMVRIRIADTLKRWAEKHWHDDCDEPALASLVPFVKERLAKVKPAIARRILELLATPSQQQPQLPAHAPSSSTAPATVLPTQSVMKGLRAWGKGTSSPQILDFNAEELARQLTIKQSKLFRSIKPEELVGKEWSKTSNSSAVNVKAMIALSTNIANLVSDTILQSDEYGKRAKVIKLWIKAADACFKLHNYDALMAIVCSLSSSPVDRLKRTWANVSAKKKERLGGLKCIVDTRHNYKYLRQRISILPLPSLPFVGMYLTDLTFNHDGNAATRTLPGFAEGNAVEAINFEKHLLTAKIIDGLLKYQIPFDLQEVPEYQAWLKNQLTRVNSSIQDAEASHYRRSQMLEPRKQLLPNASTNLAGSAPQERSKSQ